MHLARRCLEVAQNVAHRFARLDFVCVGFSIFRCGERWLPPLLSLSRRRLVAPGTGPSDPQRANRGSKSDPRKTSDATSVCTARAGPICFPPLSIPAGIWRTCETAGKSGMQIERCRDLDVSDRGEHGVQGRIPAKEAPAADRDWKLLLCPCDNLSVMVNVILPAAAGTRASGRPRNSN
jgi:hypothetical protein